MAILSNEELIARMATVSGHLVTDPEVLANWSRDWWSFTAKLEDDPEEAPAVALVPDCAADVAAIVRIAADAGRPIVVKGGGSAVTGAIEPVPYAILIDSRGLNVIEPVNEIDGTVTVDAGVIGGELETRLNQLGFTLGHEPESLHYSTVGGWLATRSMGVFSTRYGGIEALVEAIEVVLPDGSIVRAKPTPRHGAGPRWLDLFLGAEGAFGIVTAVTLRVWPLPEERRLQAWSLPEFGTALDAVRRLAHRGIRPAAIRLYDPEAGAEVAEAFGIADCDCLLIVASDGPAAMVELELGMLGAEFAAIGGRELGEESALAWYGQRHRADWLLDPNEHVGVLADRVDLAVPWSRVPAVREAVLATLRLVAASSSAVVTHVDHSGAMLVVTFMLETDDDDAVLDACQRAWQAVMRAALDGGASIVHNTGIGQARLPWLEEELGSGLAILQKIKGALDPDGRFNPGRLLP